VTAVRFGGGRPDTHDEWQVAERRYLSEESMAALAHMDKTETDPLPEAPIAITA